MGPSFWQDLIGGNVGGVIGLTVVYPLDTVKCRLQTTGEDGGITHVLTSMARKEGVMSWYRGLMSPVAGYGSMFALSFSSYGAATRFLQRRKRADDNRSAGAGSGGGAGELTLWEMGAAGLFAGIVNSPLRTTFERVKTVMQVRRGQEGRAPYSWSGACAVDLVRKEGVAMGLFRGMGSTALREAPQQAVYFPVYAVTKAYLIPPDRGAADTGLPEPLLQMLAGGVSGCAAWLPPLYCVDVIKTRMQSAEPGVYKGAWDCFKKTVRAEGVPVLFRGIGASMLRAFPMHGLVFLGYETTIRFLGAI
eukprot:g4408.t1